MLLAWYIFNKFALIWLFKGHWSVLGVDDINSWTFQGNSYHIFVFQEMCQVEACFDSGRNLLFKVSLLSTAQTLETLFCSWSAKWKWDKNSCQKIEIFSSKLRATTSIQSSIQPKPWDFLFSLFVVHHLLAEDDDNESMFQTANLRARHHERVSRNEPSHQVKSTRSSVSQTDPLLI